VNASGKTLDRRRGTSVPNQLTCAREGRYRDCDHHHVESDGRAQPARRLMLKIWGYSALFGFS
jgi:hypothetical protein